MTAPITSLLEAKTRRLLKANEEITAATEACLRFFARHPRLHATVGRNHAAVSCADAASKRRRLGYEGIPLYKELKTGIYAHKTVEGKWRLLLTHCAGDRELDMEVLKAGVPGLDGELIRFESEALPKGTITPFAFDKEFITGAMGEHPIIIDAESSQFITVNDLDAEHPVFHIFDTEIFDARVNGNDIAYRWDYMTTNLGALFLGVEIRPDEIYAALASEGQAIRNPIVNRGQTAEDSNAPDRIALSRKSEYAHHKIGIITGNSPNTGALFLTKIVAYYQALLGKRGCTGDLANPPFEMKSIPGMGESMEMDGRAEEVLATLLDAAKSLIEKEGCSIITLPCNTTDCFKDELSFYCAQKGAIFISISDAVMAHMQEQSINELFLVGGNAVSSLGPWSAYAKASEAFSIRGLPEDLLETVHAIGYEVKRGADAHRVVQLMRRVWDYVENEGSEGAAAIIALTELSEVFDGQHAKALKNLKVLVIDALDVYSQAVAKTAYGTPRWDATPDFIVPMREGLLLDGIRASFRERQAQLVVT